MSFVEKDQLNDAKAKVRADYGENRKISDGNYGKSLAVKCINGRDRTYFLTKYYCI